MSYDNVMNGYGVTAEQGERMIAAALGQSFDPPAPYNNVANRTHMTAEQGERLIEAIEQGGGGSGTTNYNNLTNKPSINGVTLTGNKTTQELLITASGAEVYDDYEDAVTAINAWAADQRGIGDNVYIRTANVPDLWVSGVEETSVPYTYTTDAAIVAALEADGYVQFGYYKLSALETQKAKVPDVQINGTSIIQDGVANIPLASTSHLGVIKPNPNYATAMSDENFITQTKTYAQYEAMGNGGFIGKGTLENVLTEKGLIATNYKTVTMYKVGSTTPETFKMYIEEVTS